MRNLIAFFRRFRVFLFFLFLQIIALSIYVQYLSFPKNQYLTTAAFTTAKVLEAENEITKHFALSENNTALQRENVRLRKKLPQSLYRIDRSLLKINDTAFKQQYSYIPATLINSTVSRRNNYFTLDAGRQQGIHRGMGVFSDKGVVGIVHNTSEHYCVVKSVLTKDINIDVTIEPIGLFGLLKWNGRNPRYGNITGISNDLHIKKWSKVITRGGSGIFPRGLTVGRVERIKVIEGEPVWDVVIKFSENFRTLQRVYIVKNLMIEEQHALENQIPPDPEE
ncbi:MAG: rod shape-determining protein MreC [Flavobacteriales bacterium]|nr:rod shape-determining protein MreC [Crocinitomicaceae bacterium]NBX79917.1 rod shape-determining protein MreC [Flavobacteriales bacterium]NCA19808.1 rod shape-determining protein MreC [Crocinitomicaceae bacterium]